MKAEDKLKSFCAVDVDGYKKFWPNGLTGSMEAHWLRMLADYLDQENAAWDAQVARDVGGNDAKG